MMVHYLDPSAWIKRYFAERGSDQIGLLFRRPLRAACSRLGLIEMIATAARKGYHDNLGTASIESLIANIQADFTMFAAVDIRKQVVTSAIEMALRHRLRAMDALHLASALMLRHATEVTLVSADLELLSAAEREHLGVLNPAPPP